MKNIEEKLFDKGGSVYIIAEMSANHGQDFDKAIQIIHEAKKSGADCIKIQTYTPDTMTIESDKEYFQIEKGTWKGENLYELYKKAYTPWEWQGKLKEEAEKVGLDFLSTPFDKTSVDFLENINIDFYKIASFEVTDIPLIKYIASKGKPIIMSTGMATLGEIEEAVKVIREEGNNKLCLLKCCSAYPAAPKDMNLRTIMHLKETFNVTVGLSDHSLESTVAITSVALGARIIEKHFCLSREIITPDSSFSMEPQEFKKMVEEVRIAEEALGEISYKISQREEVSRLHRRSIFVVRDIKKGEIFTEDNIRIIRPAQGIAPKYYDNIIGKSASRAIELGTPIDWSMIN